MPIFFVNPGEIDIRAATIVGLNAKSSEGSIGRFGTGLKYSIAVLLREHLTIRIYAGLKAYSFKAKSIVIRGKEFGLVYMQEDQGPWKELAFTTEYGKDWDLHMVYRELYSNMIDEGGTEVFDGGAIPMPGRTVIVVEGDAFRQVHRERYLTILLQPGLTKVPLNEKLPGIFTPKVEVYNKRSSIVYYRGIAAYQLQKPSLFTYNIIAHSGLSENRQLDLWAINALVIQLVKENVYPSVTFRILAPEVDTYEAGLNWHYESGWSDETLEAMENLDLHDPLNLSPSARAELRRIKPSAQISQFEKLAIEDHVEAMIVIAIETLCSHGFRIERENVSVVKELGPKILGRVIDGKIFLAQSCLRTYPLLFRTLLEETCHTMSGFSDETREFQNYLLDHMTRVLCGTLPPTHAQTTIERLLPPSDEIPF